MSCAFIFRGLQGMSTWHAYCGVNPTIKCLLRLFLSFTDTFSPIYIHLAFVYISAGDCMTPILCPWKTSLINYSPSL